MAEPIHITRALTIDPSEIEESFVRGSGPGGQNVNKVASAVQLRFNLRENTSLPEAMKRRVAALAGSRLTKDGTIVITAHAHRDQPLNRADALERLVGLLRAGVHPPKPRIATRPTLASKKRRLEKKTSRSSIKRLRSRPADTD